MMWTRKHEPKTVEELVISENTKNRFTKFLKDYGKEKKKALLLWSGTGTGKTLLPILYAKQNNYDITELNASSKRSKKVIETNLKNMVTTASIFGNQKIILIDEVDCLGRSDRGGLNAIIDAIKITKFPIILTAEDYWDSKISKLRKHVLGLEIEPAVKEKKIGFLKQVLEKEKANYEEEALKKIITTTDIRGILNDLQALHYAGGITLKNLDETGYRNKKQELKKTINKILCSKNYSQALKELNKSEQDLRELVTWISENLPHYNADKKHYDLLSQTDTFAGRIMRRQYWRLMYYQRMLLAGINNLEGGGVKYPEIIKKMFVTRSKRAKRDSITEKLGCYLHASKYKTGKYYLNWIGKLKELEQLELEKEEINYLKTI